MIIPEPRPLSARPLERVVGRRCSHQRIEHTQVQHLSGVSNPNNIARPVKERKHPNGIRDPGGSDLTSYSGTRLYSRSSEHLPMRARLSNLCSTREHA